MMAAMAPRSRRSAPLWAALALAALTGGSLTACSWRLESPPPPPLVADAHELGREQAARALARLQAALQAESGIRPAPTAGPASSASLAPSAEPTPTPSPSPSDDASNGDELRAALAIAVPVQLEALGGLYLPYPDSFPSPSPSLGPIGSVEEEARAARDVLLAVAVDAEDPQLALVTASAGLFLAVTLNDPGEWAAASAPGADPSPAGEPTPGVSVSPTASASPGSSPSPVPAESWAPLLLAHDRAVYIYDVIAARSLSTARQAASARALAHDLNAEVLAALVPTDPRRPQYHVDPQTLADAASLDALARQTEREVAEAYLATLTQADPGDRAWLLAGAYASLAAAAAWPGYEPGELPPLPGIRLPSPSPSP